MNISHSEPADLDVTHVEIVLIIPNRASVIHGQTIRLDFSEIGQRIFLVDLVEADGGRCGMWDGRSYERAIIEAEELARDFECGVVDLVAARDG